ncbi:citrate transporter [Vibrio sp. MACH09]|uniref:GntP family permease n=1 Tax=unclassified Vibrio TaxID=2614977 RepID=UPI0014935A41|nr:GntP family permease [Vibrio sp. MACH09]NOI67148.1 GntP family permease [Vibrio sp. 99-8-1]GLO63486.1 citrate transporter [Vibrio sp. MACH09]
MYLGIFGILLSLVMLMYLAYKGMSVIWLAPILALVAAMFSVGTPLMASFTEVFMSSAANYVKLYFPAFLLGAIFGKVMDASGAAKSIAEVITKKIGATNSILAVVLAVSVLTYGGVSMFVVVFAVYPIAADIFRRNDVPKRLIPGSIALGSFTYTMTALPGSPQIQNTIAMPFFGTTAYAAPMLGIIASVVMFGLGMLWLKRRESIAKENGEGYGVHIEKRNEADGADLPSATLAFIPIVIVLALNFIIVTFYYPNIDTSYLSDYGVTLSKVNGMWSLIIALTTAIVVAIALFHKYMPNVKQIINEGSLDSVMPIMNTAAAVGFGNVIKSLAAFVVIKQLILAIPGTPLLSFALSTSLLAGITGSASGGLSIALDALGQTYIQQASELGISLEVLHRIASIACGGLDSLPHNGAVITLLAICGMTHRESYKDIFVCTLFIPIIATGVTLVFAVMGVV